MEIGGERNRQGYRSWGSLRGRRPPSKLDDGDGGGDAGNDLALMKNHVLEICLDDWSLLVRGIGEKLTVDDKIWR